VQEPYSKVANSLVRNAGSLWDEATRSPFLDALGAGILPADALRRWLAQDYLFAKELISFQAVALAKAPRDCHKALAQGLVALDGEMEWFEAHAGRLEIDLDVVAHSICRRYTHFLMRCAYTQSCPVLLAMLFGVEASYLASWGALAPSGPYAEFIERWSSTNFATYVAALGALAERHPHPASQEHFNAVLLHEREFWKMSWEG
jgi:formylaminopyrimidine deformylase / aminopyrimidine aminohydrolase